MVFVSAILRQHCKIMSKNKKMVLGYSQADLTAEEDEHVLSEILIHTVSAVDCGGVKIPPSVGTIRSYSWILAHAEAEGAGKSKLCCHIAGQVGEHL